LIEHGLTSAPTLYRLYAYTVYGNNPDKANNTKQNYPGFVAFYDTRPGKRWAYSTTLPSTRALDISRWRVKCM